MPRYGCTDCAGTFGDRDELTEHFVEFHAGPATCDVCGKSFSKKNHLRRHRDEIHFGKFFLRPSRRRRASPKHECDLCGKTFVYSLSFKKHREKDHRNTRRRKAKAEEGFVCDVCGEEHFTKEDLDVHKW